jgi:hypothetical protein
MKESNDNGVVNFTVDGDDVLYFNIKVHDLYVDLIPVTDICMVDLAFITVEEYVEQYRDNDLYHRMIGCSELRYIDLVDLKSKIDTYIASHSKRTKWYQLRNVLGMTFDNIYNCSYDNRMIFNGLKDAVKYISSGDPNIKYVTNNVLKDVSGEKRYVECVQIRDVEKYERMMKRSTDEYFTKRAKIYKLGMTYNDYFATWRYFIYSLNYALDRKEIPLKITSKHKHNVADVIKVAKKFGITAHDLQPDDSENFELFEKFLKYPAKYRMVTKSEKRID